MIIPPHHIQIPSKHSYINESDQQLIQDIRKWAIDTKSLTSLLLFTKTKNKTELRKPWSEKRISRVYQIFQSETFKDILCLVP